MSSDLNVEQVQQKEVAIAVTTKNSTCKGDQESIRGESNTNNDANLLHQPQDLRDIQPLSKDYIGLPISYWNIGINGKVPTLYPFLIVLNNVSSAFYTSSVQLVNLFWNYQIVYGICYDAYYPPPNYNQKFKPWIYWGWTANAAILLIIAILVSNTTDPYSFVVLLTIGNFFEIVAVCWLPPWMVSILGRCNTNSRNNADRCTQSTINFNRADICF